MSKAEPYAEIDSNTIQTTIAVTQREAKVENDALAKIVNKHCVS